MKTCRLWYIVMIGGVVMVMSLSGCKREEIERHRVAKMPAGQQSGDEETQMQTTNAGRLPEGHPDVGNMTQEQMDAMRGVAGTPGVGTPGLAGGADVTYALPAGWVEKQPPGAMLLHEFTAGDVRMTVSMFPGNGGGLLANVNRWRGQLGMEAVDQEGLMKVVKPVSVDGVEGWRVVLTGQGEGGKETVGVIVERDGAAWFFKLNGESEAVGGQVEAFDAFIKSVKWKS